MLNIIFFTFCDQAHRRPDRGRRHCPGRSKIENGNQTGNKIGLNQYIIESGKYSRIFEFESHHISKHNLRNFLLKFKLSFPTNAIASSELNVFTPKELYTARSVYIVT